MKKSLFIFALVIFFTIQIFVPTVNVKAAGTDITGTFPFITDLKITDPNGNDLGNNISKSAEIHINYTWSIPNGQNINQGDFYTMQLPDKINIVKAIDQPIVDPGNGSTVANMYVDTDGKVTITFTDYASKHSDVHGGFLLDCHFDKDKIGNTNPVYIDFTIPSKGVIVQGPYNFQQSDPSVVKSGSYNAVTNEIAWKITINNQGVNLNNATVEDIIDNGQEFENNSVFINSSSAVDGTNYTYDSSGKKLVLNLGNITTQQVITYKTNVSADLISKVQGTYTYRNTAVLNYEDNSTPKSITSNTASVSANVKYISKSGSYNSSTKSIDWTITVNESARTITNAVVTDSIPAGLTVTPSSVKVNSAASAGYTISGQNLIFSLGDITSKQTITFSTAVDPSVFSSNVNKYYNNIVYLSGGGVPSGTSANKSITVTSNIIQKQGTDYNYATREISWKIVVNKNNIPIKNAIITDNIPIGQQYVDNSAAIDNGAPSNGFNYTDTPSDSSKTGVLTYSFPNGSSNTINDTYTITFKTKVTDLSIFNSNGSKSVHNTASIVGDEIPASGNRQSTGTQTINNTVIDKTPSYTYGNAYIDWTLNINSNYSIPIGGATITDNLQDGLSLDTSTVELYKAIVNADGSLSAGDKVTLTGDNVKYDSNTRAFNFTFPQDAGTSAYILKFTTDASKAGNYSNAVEFKNQSASGTQSNVWFSNGSGWGVGINGSITVLKVDSNDNTKKLSGAVFLIIDQYGNVKETSAATGSDGKIVFNNLKYDTDYSIKEITAPAGYNLSSEIYKFQVHNVTDEKDITYNYQDTRIKKDISFKKLGEDGNGLQGAEFTLYEDDGVTPVKDSEGADIKAVSDQNGNVIFKDAEYGNYKIKESKAPGGYLLSSSVLTVSFSGDYQNTTVTITPDSISNVLIRGRIKITKTDSASNKPLQGTTVTVYTIAGKAIAKGITGADGTVEFDNLAYGDYYYMETEAPEGYSIDTYRHPFSIVTDSVVLSDTFSDDKISGTLKIESIGENDKTISKDQILPKTGELIDNTVMIITGLLIILAGIWLISIERKNENS